MANVRKVTHRSGAQSWRATVTTLDGSRKSMNFPRKGEAADWAKANERADASGSATMTMMDLARSHNRWFDKLVADGERARITSDGYDSHLRIHLAPDAIAKSTLDTVSPPLVQAFLERVAEKGSIDTARRVKKSLSAWFEHGMRNGWIKANAVGGTKIVKKRRRTAKKLVVIPAKNILTRLLTACREGTSPERDAVALHLLMFGGLRISEMLGAADAAVELGRPGPAGKAGGVINIEERLCSRHVTMGDVKTEDGLRSVPIGPATASTVRAWRVARGPSPTTTVDHQRLAGRLFPGRHGPFWSYPDFRRTCWDPMMVRAGLGETVKTGAHFRTKVAFGPHTLRHVFASIQIENGITPKRLQTLLGHATLAMTMDLYGHLWTDPEGDQVLAEAGERFFTSGT